MVWLCNPNNPTGRYFPPPDVQALLESAPDAGALLVIDEAYAPFVDGATSPLPLLSGGHLVLLRSLTKDYALAGLRLGYAVATPGLAASLRLAQPPWSVSALAQAPAWRRWPSPGTSTAPGRCCERPVPASSPACASWASASPPRRTSSWWRWATPPLPRALRGQGCIVRDCTSFGLPRHVRIGVRTPPECDRLMHAVQRAARKEGA